LYRQIIGYLPSNAITAVVSMVMIYAYTRLLSPGEFGSYSYVFSAVLVLEASLFHALPIAVMRFYPAAVLAGRRDALLKEAYLALYGLSAVVAAICVGAGLVVHLTTHYRVAALLALPLLLFRSMVQLNQAVNRSNNSMGRFTVVECLHAVLGFGFGLAGLFILGRGADAIILGLLIAAVIAMRTLPSTPMSGIKFDGISAALQAIAIGTLLFGISQFGHGESWIHIVLEFVVAGVSGFLLVMRQLSRSSPLLPVDLLRIPLFALSVVSSVCSFIAQSIAQVSLPFLFQHRFEMDQVMTGLLMTPWPLVVAVLAPFIGRLADRYPAGLLGGGGMAVMAIGLFLMSLLPDHPTTVDIVWRMTVCGIGFGFFNTPNNRAIITSAPPARTGGASGMQATARLFGQSIGAAMVALVFTAFPANGTTVALVIASIAAAVAACVSFSRLAA